MNRIGKVLITTILVQVLLWTGDCCPMDTLRVPLGLSEQELAGMMRKEQLIDIVSDVTGESREEVELILNQLPPEDLRQAWLRRFNFKSEFFTKRFVRLWQSGSDEMGGYSSKADALHLLTEGYLVLEKLGSRGDCTLDFGNMEPAFVKELSIELNDMRIYMSPKRNNEDVVVEWAWIPDLGTWLPVQLDSTILRTLFKDDGTIIKIGAHNSGKKELNKFYGEYGEGCKLCMRVGKDGHFLMGHEKIKPSGRETGQYKKSEEADNIVIGTIGQNGVPVEFFFLGGDEIVYPKKIVVKDRKGNSNLIESHLALDADTLRGLTQEQGSFWVFSRVQSARFNIGAKAISGKLSADRLAWADRYLETHSTDEDYILHIKHFLQVPSEAESTQTLMIGGVPAYIRRGNQNVIVKRLESVSKEGSMARDPIDCFVNDIPGETLVKTLAHAGQNDLDIVATRLVCTLSGRDGGPGWHIGVAGQKVYIPSGLAKEGFESAEVIYDPADVVYDEVNGQAMPKPKEVRIGHYTTGDPDRLVEAQFIVHDVFSLAEDRNSPGRFVAYKEPVGLDSKVRSKTDI